jgi:hypothetical protein
MPVCRGRAFVARKLESLHKCALRYFLYLPGFGLRQAISTGFLNDATITTNRIIVTYGAMTMASERLGKLLEKKEAINARIRREQAKARESERNADTRRKILVGAAVLDRSEKDEASRTELQKLLARFLIRADDRALFGLAPMAQEKNENTPSPQSNDRVAA